MSQAATKARPLDFASWLASMAGKTCTRCGEQKALSEYHRQKGGKHGGVRVVSGLHVEGNLQYLTRSENRSKHNRYIPAWQILRPDLLKPDLLTAG